MFQRSLFPWFHQGLKQTFNTVQEIGRQLTLYSLWKWLLPNLFYPCSPSVAIQESFRNVFWNTFISINTCCVLWHISMVIWSYMYIMHTCRKAGSCVNQRSVIQFIYQGFHYFHLGIICLNFILIIHYTLHISFSSLCCRPILRIAHLAIICSKCNTPKSYQYRKSHCGDKTVVRSSYLHNGISYTGKMASLYWISTHISSDRNKTVVRPSVLFFIMWISTLVKRYVYIETPLTTTLWAFCGT